MRIRSIKPEFWRSEDIAGLSWTDRLLFIGLWSYVDDNGVGRDLPKVIVADLFALEDDPRETLATVSRGLSNLAEAGLIERYDVEGKPYLHIASWDAHQRIDKPNKARYPLPTCENAFPRDTLATPSRASRETPAPGAVEQGNRGTGEAATRGAVAPRDDEPPTDLDQPTAATLIAEWIDHCDTRPPSRVIGQLSKEIKTLLSEGTPYPEVRDAVATWHTKGLHPSTLASVVHENRATKKPTRATGTTRALTTLEIAARYEEQEGAGNAAQPGRQIAG